MKEKLNRLIREMIRYDSGSPKRIQHFLKVLQFAELIGEGEGLDEAMMDTLTASAVVHDIGIRPALEKYGSEAGPLQEKEGPPQAVKLLEQNGGYTPDQITRIAELVGTHHTYDVISGIDHRILIEADCLVKLYENGNKYQAILSAENKIFETETGKWILRCMFGLEL